jgi:hypothetical protein
MVILQEIKLSAYRTRTFYGYKDHSESAIVWRPPCRGDNIVVSSAGG